jgi:NADPH:quinone reductase
MRAVLCRSFDGPSLLALGEIDPPSPGPGEVLVNVHASAVSFMDTLMVSGKYQMRPTLPFVPGSDAAGTVSALGAGVTGLQVGDRVACGHWFGSYAEQMVAPASTTVRLPDNVDFITGAAVRYGYGTAYYGLVHGARLRAGETVFVSGASGGVGLAAVDLARHLGAYVIAGVGRADKAAITLDRGADQVVVYGSENLHERIKSMTAGRGVDVCFDNVGGEIFGSMTRLMNWGGRMLPIGFTSGAIPSVPMNLLLLKNYTIVGSFWGAWAQRFPDDSARADERLFEWISSGHLRPHIDQVIPLERFGDALRLVEQRQVQGQIVLSLP